MRIDEEFDTGIDIDEYINKRMLEISQLEERELYKEIVGSMIKKVYEYNIASYQELEKKILGECSSDRSNYSIYITLTDKEHYDATDQFMSPIIEDSIKEKEILCSDLMQSLEDKIPLKLYTVFVQASASDIYKILHKERKFNGILKTRNREYKGTFLLKRNEEYLDKIKELYYIYETNYQSWTTVCEAYLMKLLDVYLYSMEEMRENEKNIVIEEIKVDFEEYTDIVHYHVIPLWNLKKITEKTSIYPEPCIDKTNYEHQIFAHRLESDCEYLVMDTKTELTNIRRRNGDLIITCPIESPYEWDLYCVNRPDSDKYNNQYSYPILSNCYKESFISDITEMYRKSIKTKAEMARLIEAYPYTDQIKFAGFELTDKEPKDWEPCNYNMDGFIEDEIRTGNKRQYLVIKFHATNFENYLNEDIMSFLVTQVQKLFPEYKCLGKLI